MCEELEAPGIPSVVCLCLGVAQLSWSKGLPWVMGLFGGLPLSGAAQLRRSRGFP